jgi:hypothetical protein
LSWRNSPSPVETAEKLFLTTLLYGLGRRS